MNGVRGTGPPPIHFRFDQSTARSKRADSADNGGRKNWGFRHACDDGGVAKGERGVTMLKIVAEAAARRHILPRNIEDK